MSTKRTKGINFIKVPIGKHYYDDSKKIYWYDYPYGSSVFIAQQGYGKSSILKDIIVKLLMIDPMRKVIIFDKGREWAYNITRPNWDSETPDCVKDFHIIENFSIKISDLDKGDWLYLDSNMTSEVLKTIGWLAKDGVCFHYDDPDLFYKMCVDLPTQKANKKTNEDPVGDWNFRFGKKLWLDEPINYEIKRSVVSKVKSIKHRFYGAKDSNKVYIDDWQREISGSKVIFIDMGVVGYKPDHFVGLVVGKILEFIAKGENLYNIRPRIIFEEADYLVGNPDNSPQYLSSKMILTYITKERKKGVSLYFISQTFGQLHPEIIKTRTALMLGSIERRDDRDLYELWKTLEMKANLVTGRRPFYYLDKIQFKKIQFFPNYPCCNVKTQGIRFDIKEIEKFI